MSKIKIIKIAYKFCKRIFYLTFFNNNNNNKSLLFLLKCKKYSDFHDYHLPAQCNNEASREKKAQ